MRSVFVHPMASSPCGACARGLLAVAALDAHLPSSHWHGCLADSWRSISRRPQQAPPPAAMAGVCGAQPETSCNVQKYDREIYARSSEAVHCRIHSVLILPLFMEAACRTAVGVLEVVQTVQDMPFARLARTLSAVLRVPLSSPAPLPSPEGTARGQATCGLAVLPGPLCRNRPGLLPAILSG